MKQKTNKTACHLFKSILLNTWRNKTSHHGVVQQLKTAAFQLHLYPFCNLKLIEKGMFLGEAYQEAEMVKYF